MKRTITIDTDLVRVVPVEPDDKMCGEAALTIGAPWRGSRRLTVLAYQSMLDSVPTDLPGVVEQSGEPFDDWPDYNAEAMGCGLEDRNITDRYEAMRYGFEQAIEHVASRLDGFTHPPAQPDTAALQERIAELEEFLADEHRAKKEWQTRCHNAIDQWKEREAQLAAQEPVIIRKVSLPERVVDYLWQQAGISTYHPDGDQLEKLQEFAVLIKNEVLARLAPIKAPAPANALAIVQAARDDVAGDASVDECIELAQALEQARAVKIAEDVAALSIGGATNSMPTPFQSGFQLACEEITHRLRTEEWDLCLKPIGADIAASTKESL